MRPDVKAKLVIENKKAQEVIGKKIQSMLSLKELESIYEEEKNQTIKD